MSKNKVISDKILSTARRGLVLAALFIFATTAAATWLASEHAQASPGRNTSIAGRALAGPAAKEASTRHADTPVVRVAEADGKLMKNGKELSGKLNINTATEEQLTMLPGIGPKKAQRILDYRAKHGKFKRVRDLRRVKGFGYKTVTKLEPYLTVDGKTTLEAN